MLTTDLSLLLQGPLKWRGGEISLLSSKMSPISLGFLLNIYKNHKLTKYGLFYVNKSGLWMPAIHRSFSVSGPPWRTCSYQQVSRPFLSTEMIAPGCSPSFCAAGCLQCYQVWLLMALDTSGLHCYQFLVHHLSMSAWDRNHKYTTQKRLYYHLCYSIWGNNALADTTKGMGKWLIKN